MSMRTGLPLTWAFELFRWWVELKEVSLRAQYLTAEAASNKVCAVAFRLNFADFYCSLRLVKRGYAPQYRKVTVPL